MTSIRHIFFRLALLLMASLCLSLVAAEKPQIVLNQQPAQVTENIINHLALNEESCALSERRVRTLSKGADKKIAAALQALGYYHSTWQKQLTFTEQCWQLEIELQLGEPMRLSAIEIGLTGEARDEPSFQTLVADYQAQTGNRLNHGDYESFKRALQQLATRLGFVQARFTRQQIQVSLEENSANVFLDFESGPRYRFGPVRFEQSAFSDAFLARYQNFQPGDLFEAKRLGQFQQRLIDSRYFKDVSVNQLVADSSALTIPIQVILTPIKRHTTAAGLGAATDSGVRATLSYRNNRANAEGHQYGADAELSSLRAALNLNYQIPLSRPDRETLKLNLGWEDVTTDTADNETWTLGAALTTLTESGWLQTIDLAYQVERFDIEDDLQHTQTLMPGISWNRSVADNLSYPRSGWRLFGSMRGAAEQVASDISFLQLRTSGKHIFSLGKSRIISRLDAGTSLVSDFSELPASLRFFAGGDNSIRGYDFREIGPQNSKGQVIGGKHLLTASLEVDYPLFKDYGVALFYDAGNAFDNSQFELKRSLGIGARWRSPIGPIRVDLAFPLGDDESFRLHLSMGPDL